MICYYIHILNIFLYRNFMESVLCLGRICGFLASIPRISKVCVLGGRREGKFPDVPVMTYADAELL